jgi:indolepyruvate ferredoxin oxidoreductase beta subunit
MAQRGGAVQSCVIIDGGVSPVIASGRADFVMGLEPVETARAIPFMSSRTVVYMNTTPVIPFVLAQRAVLEEQHADYPDIQQLVEAVRTVTPQTFAFDATQCAAEAGAMQALNMVMLGCLLSSGSLPCTTETFWDIVGQRIPPKFREINTRAYRKGTEFAKGFRVAGGTR